ncbi:MAG: phosphoglycerate kinase [Candidatus Hydrothermarchaeota archaeon]|nr:MAG: phosphoglycerate kinase [Candidatus Hydrothermarchaeota archaeon]
MELPTIKNYDLRNKKVLLRLDINSPLDPRSGEILDTFRIRSHIPTLEALSDSKVVVLAHQSRPGLEDFTTLEKHADKLAEFLDKEVKYIDDIFGSAAREEIANLENGEVLVLENVRFCSEEVSENVIRKPPEEQAKTIFVRKLSPCVDFYVNDAFAVSHRSQPSVVAFPKVLPSAAGLLLDKEVKTLREVLKCKDSPRVFLFGGAKAKDTLKVIENLLKNELAEYILTSGIVGNLFLKVRGYSLGKENERALKEEEIEVAKKLDNEKIITPLDIAYSKEGKRKEIKVENLKNSNIKIKILDIGRETIAYYSSIIRQAKLVVANGPCGVFEMEEFALGTKEIIKQIANSKAISILGGGHLSAIARSMRMADKITYISTGGKACLRFLAGEKLVGLEVLR